MCWVVVSMIRLTCGVDVTTTVEVEVEVGVGVGVGVGVDIAELLGHSPVISSVM